MVLLSLVIPAKAGIQRLFFADRQKQKLSLACGERPTFGITQKWAKG
jgi:hypothetical protein